MIPAGLSAAAKAGVVCVLFIFGCFLLAVGWYLVTAMGRYFDRIDTAAAQDEADARVDAWHRLEMSAPAPAERRASARAETAWRRAVEAEMARNTRHGVCDDEHAEHKYL